MCLPMCSKFLTESIGEKIVKIDKYLAKIWTKYDSLLFLGHSVHPHAALQLLQVQFCCKHVANTLVYKQMGIVSPEPISMLHFHTVDRT